MLQLNTVDTATGSSSVWSVLLKDTSTRAGIEPPDWKTYTTVQKFGVIQTISCPPWKLTFIYQMNWKLNRTYSQDIDKVKNNDSYLKY